MIELARHWILVVPALGVVAALVFRRPRPGVALTSSCARADTDTGARRLDQAPTLLRGGAILALSLAAAAPFRAAPGASGASPSGAAVMLVLDVSESMGESLPSGVSRLDAARREIVRFLDGRPGDATGLVTFGRDAIVRVPPSLGRDALLASLAAAGSDEPGGGTALGTALGLAADRLRAVDATSKVIVVVTDGESNAGSLDPLTAAKAARSLGQRVHVVDVSVDREASALLAEIARAGGGSDHVVGDEAGLDAAYREIAALEGGPERGPERTARLPAGGALLWAALALLAAERGVRASRWGALP